MNPSKVKVLVPVILSQDYVASADTLEYQSVVSQQSYLALCDPMNCSPSGSSVHEILQQ